MYVVTDCCENCGTCEFSCPTGAIHSGEDHREIDQTLCCQCGACFNGCPVEAIEEQ